MTSPVEQALSVLLPTADETALLEACLHTGDRAREGWRRWRAARPSSPGAACTDLSATRTLLPLLARSARVNGLDVEPEALSYVRAATLREELRASRYRQVAAEALAAFDGAPTTPFVVGGAALAATVYDAWSHRHCHDLDLLVAQEALAEAVEALGRGGFAPAGPTPDPGAGSVMAHASGLQVALHARPFGLAYYDVPVEAFAGSGRPVTIGGAHARTPSPEASLVHVLGHATYSPGRRHLRWVADVWHIVSRHADLDWMEVSRRLDEYRLALPVSVLLAYLANLGVAVPPGVLARVRTLATAVDRVAEDVALGGAFVSTAGDLSRLWRSTPSWSSRLRVVRWALAPSPGYMRSVFRPPSDWLYPLGYAYRPARFVARTLLRRAAPRPTTGP